jgi:hypothetical protein
MSDSVVAEFSSARSPFFSFILVRYAIWHQRLHATRGRPHVHAAKWGWCYLSWRLTYLGETGDMDQLFGDFNYELLQYGIPLNTCGLAHALRKVL